MRKTFTTIIGSLLTCFCLVLIFNTGKAAAITMTNNLTTSTISSYYSFSADNCQLTETQFDAESTRIVSQLPMDSNGCKIIQKSNYSSMSIWPKNNMLIFSQGCQLDYYNISNLSLATAVKLDNKICDTSQAVQQTIISDNQQQLMVIVTNSSLGYLYDLENIGSTIPGKIVNLAERTSEPLNTNQKLIVSTDNDYLYLNQSTKTIQRLMNTNNKFVQLPLEYEYARILTDNNRIYAITDSKIIMLNKNLEIQTQVDTITSTIVAITSNKVLRIGEQGYIFGKNDLVEFENYDLPIISAEISQNFFHPTSHQATINFTSNIQPKSSLTIELRSSSQNLIFDSDTIIIDSTNWQNIPSVVVTALTGQNELEQVSINYHISDPDNYSNFGQSKTINVEIRNYDVKLDNNLPLIENQSQQLRLKFGYSLCGDVSFGGSSKFVYSIISPITQNQCADYLDFEIFVQPDGVIEDYFDELVFSANQRIILSTKTAVIDTEASIVQTDQSSYSVQESSQTKIYLQNKSSTFTASYKIEFNPDLLDVTEKNLTLRPNSSVELTINSKDNNNLGNTSTILELTPIFMDNYYAKSIIIPLKIVDNDDLDQDGIIDESDCDIGNNSVLDVYENSTKHLDNIDCDDFVNEIDSDLDGDGLQNDIDDDTDGDQFLNIVDDDIDNDSISNDLDQTIFGASSSDIDADNIPDDIEVNAPNNGDANDDGISDYMQSHVATIYHQQSQNFVTVQSNCPNINKITSDSENTQAVADNHYIYPLGLMTVSANCPKNIKARFSFILPGDYQIGDFELKKYDTKLWGYTDFDYDYISAIRIEQKPAIKVVYSALDGGTNDSDLAVDGRITTPIGLAFPTQITTNYSSVDLLIFNSTWQKTCLIILPSILVLIIAVNLYRVRRDRQKHIYKD